MGMETYLVDISKIEAYAKYKKEHTHVYLIRHGETHFNGEASGEDKIRGWIDVPLNEKGKEQAQEVAEASKKLELKGLASSDLIRAWDTAKAVGEAVKLTPIKEFGLRPWNLGSEIQGHVTKKVIDKIHHHVYHGDEVPTDGESFNTFKKRYIDTIHKYHAMFNDKTVGLVTHYRGLKLMKAWQKAGAVGYNIDEEEFCSHHAKHSVSMVPPGYIMHLQFI